jgi:hypothetical protein
MYTRLSSLRAANRRNIIIAKREKSLTTQHYHRAKIFEIY